MNNILVREAAPLDRVAIEEINELAVADLRKVYHPIHGPSNRPIPRISGRLVAEINRRVVGTVSYCLEPDRIHLIGLMVHPGFRRSGVARGMVEYLGEKARKGGIGKLSLYTIKETGNVSIFNRLGFTVIRESQPTDVAGVRGRSVTEVYMECIV